MAEDPRLPAIQTLVEPLAAEAGMEIVELTCRPQGGQLFIRLLVDRAGGVTLQQCARVNQLIGRTLDEAQLIEERYTIEVSSPGLDRPLTTKRDFERALGEELQLRLSAEEARHQELRGMLLAVQADALVINTTSGNVTVPLAQVRGAKKVMRW